MIEFQDVPESDRDAFAKITDDFHRHGYDLVVFHPRSETWHAQWRPHGETMPVGETPPGHVSALDTAQRAWETYQGP